MCIRDSSVTALASFDQEKESWFIENGKYGIFLGESLESARLVAGIEVAEEIEVAKMESVCASKKTLDVLKGNRQGCEQKRKLWMEKGIIQDYICLLYTSYFDPGSTWRI